MKATPWPETSVTELIGQDHVATPGRSHRLNPARRPGKGHGKLTGAKNSLAGLGCCDLFDNLDLSGQPYSAAATISSVMLALQ